MPAGIPSKMSSQDYASFMHCIIILESLLTVSVPTFTLLSAVFVSYRHVSLTRQQETAAPWIYDGFLGCFQAQKVYLCPYMKPPTRSKPPVSMHKFIGSLRKPPGMRAVGARLFATLPGPRQRSRTWLRLSSTQ